MRRVALDVGVGERQRPRDAPGLDPQRRVVDGRFIGISGAFGIGLLIAEGREVAEQFFTGYLLEFSLSLDKSSPHADGGWRQEGERAFLDGHRSLSPGRPSVAGSDKGAEGSRTGEAGVRLDSMCASVLPPLMRLMRGDRERR